MKTKTKQKQATKTIQKLMKESMKSIKGGHVYDMKAFLMGRE